MEEFQHFMLHENIRIKPGMNIQNLLIKMSIKTVYGIIAII